MDFITTLIQFVIFLGLLLSLCCGALASRLLGDAGTVLETVVARERFGRFPDDADRMVGHAMVLDNATYRVAGIGETRTRYLALAFKLTAVSDEKREEILHPFTEEKVTVGLLMYAQALLMARYIRGDLDGYPPFIWK